MTKKQNELREIREAILKQLKWQLQDNLKDWGENEYNGLTTNILKAIKKPTEALYKQEIEGKFVYKFRMRGKDVQLPDLASYPASGLLKDEIYEVVIRKEQNK